MDKAEESKKRDFLEELIYTGFEPRTPPGKDGKAGPHDSRVEDGGRPRRYTQDSPVMPDVWIHYGLEPFRRHELLLTPMNDRRPGKLAEILKKRLTNDKLTPSFQKGLGRQYVSYGTSRIAYNQTTVVADLWFHELIRVALPLTSWWDNELLPKALEHREGRVKSRKKARTAEEKQEWRRAHHPVELLIDPDDKKSKAKERRESWLREDLIDALTKPDYEFKKGLVSANLAWMARVVGTIAQAADFDHFQTGYDTDDLDRWSRDAEGLTNALFELLRSKPAVDDGEESLLFSINRNRPTVSAIYRSVPTVKADAARTVFDVKGEDITWAILDSGIDATHLAFRKRDLDNVPEKLAFEQVKKRRRRANKNGADKPDDWKNNTRIERTYDFTNVRDLLSIDPSQETLDFLDAQPDEVREQLPTDGEGQRSLVTGRIIDWEALEPLFRVEHDGTYKVPASSHGTHVAGILAADWRHSDDENDILPEPVSDVADRPNNRTGVCPKITLYDLRVQDDEGKGDEFSIMAALQFVRTLNARRDYVEIHGVNLSLSIKHEVANYACGRTPVCDECNRLVGAGTVVVAAAGNYGRMRFMTRNGEEESYSSVSITDPGNAEHVITVGATHGREPHTYGVSYFSSRGPTGDGRLKPDLVAPGEKITSTSPHDREESQDGTSMAAPHVSGAAGLLMARHPELIGQPMRIKQILCDTATDLGRERYFQGSGLLDVLRAMQSI